jgi:hypothetical protein
MSEQLQGVALTSAVLLVIALLGILGNLLVKRMNPPMTEADVRGMLNKLTTDVYGDGKTPGLLERITVTEARADSAEATAAALGRIIRDLARQWVGVPPRLNPDDLQALDVKYIPGDHPWRKPPTEGSS